MNKMLRVLIFVAAGLAMAVALPAIALAAPADYVDADHNGYIDAYVREWNAYYDSNWNVSTGMKCVLTTNSSGASVDQITVRPPRVFPLNGLASQVVAWRTMLVNKATGAVYQYPQWVYAIAYRSGGTEFGGSGDTGADLPNSNAYWTNSQVINATGGNWTVYVNVAWENPSTGAWTSAQLPVLRDLYPYDYNGAIIWIGIASPPAGC